MFHGVPIIQLIKFFMLVVWARRKEEGQEGTRGGGRGTIGLGGSGQEEVGGDCRGGRGQLRSEEKNVGNHIKADLNNKKISFVSY